MEAQQKQFIELLNHDLSEQDITRILHAVTGHIYTFATASDMRWGKNDTVEHKGEEFPNGFYQLMPDAMDDGFFDWYCYHRDEQQFFASPETAALHFIYYWTQWNRMGKPKAF
jgi:hypothetical protein